ncbi:mycothiol transferase [Actinopolymorpha singaporensis]|uniref:mycothiol transferase n=1 Tax=Actinopolymorpha singaporensis TaxID=117157 RepID=UPI000B8A2A79
MIPYPRCGSAGRRAVRTSRCRQVSLRWICLHLIKEYARHNGRRPLVGSASWHCL